MKKLLVFDVEGTIFKADYQIDGVDYKSTMWQPIARELGEDAVKEEYLLAKKYDKKSKHIDYLSWIKDSIQMHKKYSLKKSKFDRLIKQAQYNVGVEEFFSKLDRNKWIPVLISGGFQSLIRRAKNDLNIEYGIAACEYFFDEYGYLDDFEIQPTDFKNKLDFVKTIAAAENINLDSGWAFVGDGKNDISIAKEAPQAFCINPHTELKKIEGIKEIESMTELFGYLDNVEITPRAPSVKTELPEGIHTVNELLSNIAKYKRKIREQAKKIKSYELKNNSKPAEEKREINTIPVDEIDYCNAPDISLDELLNVYKVVFLGLKPEYLSFQWIKNKNITLISADQMRTANVDLLNNKDFVFVYKNCIGHSGGWHMLNNTDLPVCYLKEHTNKGILGNAIANVLLRWSKTID